MPRVPKAAALGVRCTRGVRCNRMCCAQVPFTPLVQRTHGVAPDLLKDPKACDTRISAGSYDAARRAAGAVRQLLL